MRSYSKQEVLGASCNSAQQLVADAVFYIHSNTPWHTCREGCKTQASEYRRLLGCLLKHAWAMPKRQISIYSFNS